MKKLGKMIICLAVGMVMLISTVTAFGVTSPLLIGDVDLDNQVTIFDVTGIQRYLASFESLSKRQLFVADVDGDGDTTIFDATNIQRKLADLPNDFYQEQVYGTFPAVVNLYSDYDSGKAMAGTAVTFGASAEGSAPLTYAFSIDGKVVQQRSENSEFTYTFATAGSYMVGVTVYNSFDDEAQYEKQYRVVDAYTIDSPMIAAAYFDTFQDRYATCVVTVNAVGGTAPYQYQYTVSGGEITGTDLEDYTVVHDDETDSDVLIQPYSGQNTTDVPTQSLEYGENYVLKIEVKDAYGELAEPVYLSFRNVDIPK